MYSITANQIRSAPKVFNKSFASSNHTRETLLTPSIALQHLRSYLLPSTMSTLRRILSRPIREQLDDGQTDLERGEELVTMAPVGRDPSTPGKVTHVSRSSFSDSEFSHPQIPVSPERYEDAMEALHGRSPRTPRGPTGATVFDVFDKEKEHEKFDEKETLPESNMYLQKAPATAYVSERIPNDQYYSVWSPVPSDNGIEEVVTDNQSYRASDVEDQGTVLTVPRIHPLHFAKLDPGSSQTSSSLSTGQLGGEASGRRGRAGFYKESSQLSQTRSPTPPGLYGRQGFSFVESSFNGSKPVMNNIKEGHFEIALGQTGPGTEDGNSLGEQDWETVPAENTQAGSSLADYSDSANISVGRMRDHANGSSLARRLMRHPGIPRPHQAYILLKDLDTGEVSSVPQHNVFEGGHRTYQHPVPFFTGDVNALSSVNSSSQNRNSHESVITDTFNEMVALHGSSRDLQSGVHGANMSSDCEMTSSSEKKGTTSPSEWISTVSESNSVSNLPHQFRTGSFAKVAVLGNKGNLTGTPEGTGAREVGSSLAGTSSPLTVPESSIRRIAQPLTPSRKLPHPHFIGTPTPKTPSSSASASQSFQSGGPSKAHHRRSSSESNCEVIKSSSSTHTSALPSPGFRGHRKRNTMADMISSGNSSFYSDEDGKGNRDQPSLRERKGRQSHVERDQISQASATDGRPGHTERDETSTESRPIFHQGVVYTDVPIPIIPHPVYGLNRPWDVPTQNRGRPQARVDRYQRPIARVESPHLHRIPRAPTAAMLERQEELSKFWAPIICTIPPFALIYGHGYADVIIATQTNGEIEAFTEVSKKAALGWGYLGTPLLIVVLVLAVIIAYK